MANTPESAEKQEKIEQAVSLAALTPETGQVLAIGYGYYSGQKTIVGNGDGESFVLDDFWARCEYAVNHGEQFVGFNTSYFDLPFLVCRSWYLGVYVPHAFLPDKYGKWNSLYIDLMERWLLKRYGVPRISLNLLCNCMGVEGKNGSGAEFARLWVESPEVAREYLLNDLRMTWDVAKKMGVI